MSSPATPPILQNPDPGATYQAAYDALGRAYWETSDMASKDLIHGAQEAMGEIITAIDKQDLANNTQLFITFKPKIDAVNKTLQTIKDEINQITKNIATAATVVSTISAVLTLWPA